MAPPLTGLVSPEYRPTLRDELAGMGPRARRATVALLALVAVGALALLLRSSSQPGTPYIHRGTVPFNLRYAGPLKRVKPGPNELLHLEWRQGGEVLASFIVEPLRLPAYTGDVGGVFGVLASRDQGVLRGRFPALEPVEEGKARVNKVPAYSSTFRASRKPRLYGRVVLLASPQPGARDGFRIVMLATPAGGADKPGDVAARGVLKIPYRTFRFGTEAP
jgi:hypothetical protein